MDNAMQDDTYAQVPRPDLQGQAPWHAIPTERLISIEHPCIIKNVNNGIKSLGGEYRLAQLLKCDKADRLIEVSLRPNDPLAKRIESKLIESHDLLVKITIPKRTGRKRKRGSSGPYVDATGEKATSDGAFGVQDASAAVTSKEMVRLARENPEKLRIAAVGWIVERHRFRGLPDFQVAMTSDLSSRVRNTFFPATYEKIKNFRVNPSSKDGQPVDLGPSPAFSQSIIPFNYTYLQNPSVKYITDATGRPVAINTQAPLRTMLQSVPLNAESVPSGPAVPLLPEEYLHPHLRGAVRKLKIVLDERSIVTRRVILNHRPPITEYRMRMAYAYTGYYFSRGPWRDAVIKFGVDPRSDPKYRFFQTMFFKSLAERERAKKPLVKPKRGGARVRKNQDQTAEETGHIFDGNTLSIDGNVWQVCDIKDPLIHRILSTTNLRTECDIYSDGWYHNGTWAKARVIMRDKIDALLAGRVPDQALYEMIATLPDIINEDTVQQTILGRKLSSNVPPKLRSLCGAVRNLAKMSTHTAKLNGAETSITPDDETQDIVFDDEGDVDEEGEHAFEFNEGEETALDAEEDSGDDDDDGEPSLTMSQ